MREFQQAVGGRFLRRRLILHCERSEAIQSGRAASMWLDCFVANAPRNDERVTHAIFVIAGLDPAIHAFGYVRKGKSGSPGQGR